jgi:hypothetical protein
MLVGVFEKMGERNSENRHFIHFSLKKNDVSNERGSSPVKKRYIYYLMSSYLQTLK